MADARSTYDETNEVWPYFMLTLLLSALVPLTFKAVASSFKKTSALSSNANHATFLTRHANRHSSPIRIVLLTLGWLLVAIIVAQIGSSSASEATELWDPYTILKVSRHATVKEIKSAYRKLSLEFHPDKIRDTAEGARERVEAVYVEITKAYRALTDDDTRENFLQFGHPDGPQPVTHGIALPAFLFNPAASALFISAYLVLFGLGIPLAVSVWWSRSSKRTRRGLLQETATQFSQLFVKEQPHFISRETLLSAVLKSPDLDEALKSAGLSLSLEERRSTLDSYLARKNDPQPLAELVVAYESARVLHAMHSISTQFKSFELCQRVNGLRRAIFQAIPLRETLSGKYLELRNVDFNGFLKTHKPAEGEELVKLLKDSRDFLPRLALLRAQFKVRGEEQVTVNSQFYLELKFVVLPIGDDMPELSPEEIDAVSNASSGSETRTPEQLNRLQPELKAARTPYFPGEVKTGWVVYVYGIKDNKLIEEPYEITHMDLHNLKLSAEQVKGGDGLVISTLNVPFSTATPPQPATFVVKVSVLSTTYFGTDVHAAAAAQVVDVPVETIPEEIEEVEESSDEEIEGLSDLDTSTDEEEEDVIETSVVKKDSKSEPKQKETAKDASSTKSSKRASKRK